MKYFRYDLRKEELFEEKIFCRNELGYYKFLDDMNSKNIYSKFFSRVDRDMHKEGRELAMKRNKGKKVTRDTEGVDNVIIEETVE